jgi:adenylosuccinate synthase
MTCDAISFISSAEQKNTKILVEGANAIMLDIDHGTYPYVTSSNTGLGGILTGLALNPRKIDKIIGVVKAYTTRVGGGPFPTEDLGPDGLPGDVGKLLQSVGREIGVTTKRPRRCGHLDLVVVKYSTAINHYDSINLTKLDILDTLPTLKVAVAYKDPVSKQALDSFPADLTLLEQVEVEYKEFPGWEKPTTGAKSFYDLPKAARVRCIQKPISFNITDIINRSTSSSLRSL